MIKRLLLLGLLGILIFGLVGCGGKEEVKKINLSGTKEVKDIAKKDDSKPQVKEEMVLISGAWALYPMGIRWTEEFKKIHPEIKIDISSGGAGKGMDDVLAQVVDIGMVSRETFPEELAKGAYPIAVTKDAVVPTINADNPYLEMILKIGIRKQTAIDIWITGKITSWQKFFPGMNIAESKDMNIYTRSDNCGAAETWAAYLGFSQKDLKGTGVYSDPGMAKTIIKDSLGIGFNNINYAYESAIIKSSLGIGYNNINYAYDGKTKKQVKGLRVIPIDLNDNGFIDPQENFYDNRDSLVRAIADGVYPSPPARDLYFVTNGKPQRPIVVEFIRWVLTDGQQYVAESGYINLSKDKIAKELSKVK